MRQPSKARGVVVRFAAVLVGAWTWSGGPVVAQRSAIQSIEWIVRETTAFCQWPYITPDGESITYSRSSSESQATFELLIANRDGSNVRPFITVPAVPSLTAAQMQMEGRVVGLARITVRCHFRSAA